MNDLILTLPHINALLNTTSGLCLIAGSVFIRRRRIRAHRTSMIGAFIASSVFLVSYVLYHTLLAYYLGRGPTTFKGQGFIRPIYFVILISHTILAVVIVPLVVVTLIRALRGRFEKHRQIARWTLPLWLYVSLTGVVVYLMLYQFYK